MDSDSPPSALVIRWNSGSVRALCPHCLGSHLHGPGPKPSSRQYRVADCGQGSYYLLYPPASFDGTTYGWEFDEKEHWLYAVSSDGRVQDPRDQILPRRQLLPEFHQQEHQSASGSTSLDELAEDLGETKIIDDETKRSSKNIEPGSSVDFDAWFEEYSATPEGRKNLFFEQITRGDVQALSSSLTGNSDSFFQGVIDCEGSTAAHYVVYSTTSRRVDLFNLLHNHGFELSKPDHHGRTPLMEAALWAREDAVRCLVQHGVDSQQRDANEMSARELSQVS